MRLGRAQGAGIPGPDARRSPILLLFAQNIDSKEAFHLELLKMIVPFARDTVEGQIIERIG